MSKSIRGYTRNHPFQAATGLIIALPGTYLYITGKSLFATGLCTNTSTSTQCLLDSVTNALATYKTPFLTQNVCLPLSQWGENSPSTLVLQIVRTTRDSTILVLTTVREQLDLDVERIARIVEDRWAPYFPLSRMISVAITTALPGAFLSFIRRYPSSWAAKHQTKIANALHVLALVTVANQRLSIQDLLVAAFVVVSFEVLQQAAHGSETLSPTEAVLSQIHGVGSRSETSGSPRSINLKRNHSSSNPEALSLLGGSKDAEIEKLNKRLAEFRKNEKARDIDLKRTKAELHNARTTLNETFAEYTSMRDELKTMKQTLGRDHQAVVYRKDIELFALRKSNEQKENYIKDRESKLDDMNRQHKAALALKDAELRNYQERIIFLERQNSPRFDSNDDSKVDSATESDSQAAVQIRFLRIKGRTSSEIDERTLDEKDRELAKLKARLAEAAVTSQALSNNEVELRRAWDANSEVQQALNNERKRHAQTQEKLHEAALRLEEEIRRSARRLSLNRLSTIEEQNAQEIEAMFNTTQDDNSRLHGKVEKLERRLREANARVFMKEQAAEALREQLRLEKAINDDMETARPSLVHRVHFQRMEGQLSDSRQKLDAKNEEIEKLHKAAGEKNVKVEELKKAIKATSSAQAKLQEDNERLQQSIKELESTKAQLMIDHERLARHRARNRTTSAEHTSARSSGTTLITEPVNIPPVPNAEEEPPLPAPPASIDPLTPSSNSIQGTPERFLRREPLSNRLSMISNDVPPAELRHTRRKSLALKSFVRKIARKDEGELSEKPAAQSARPRTALMSKDRNELMRPKTAAPVAVEAKQDEENERPKTAAQVKENGHRRFYSESFRPKTAVTGIKKDEDEIKDEIEKPKSRGWTASKKLVRRSIA